MRLLIAAAALCSILWPSAAFSRPSAQIQNCINHDDPEVMLRACQGVIKSGARGMQLAAARNNAGVAYLRLGDFENAAEQFSAAIRAQPRYVLALSNRARALKSLGRYAEARDDLDTAIKISSLPEHYVLRAELYVLLDEQEEALADYNAAIKKRPREAAFYADRAEVLVVVGRVEDALEDLSRAIALQPRNPNFYFSRALAYANAGRCDVAIGDYSKAIELSPRFSNAYNNRGVCYSRAGERDKAIADYKRALELDPANRKARDNLAGASQMAPVQLPPAIPPIRDLKIPEFQTPVIPNIDLTPLELLPDVEAKPKKK